MDAPFAINPDLTAIAVAWENRELIADLVLPRVQPVFTQTFKYTSFPQGEVYTVPDTRVGRRGAPNVVEFGGVQLSASTTDYGLEDEIPQSDIDQAAQAQQLNAALATPQAHSTEMITNLIGLDREVRVAGLVFNTATYGSNNKTTLAGTTQWSDATNATPDIAISDALEAMTLRGNTAVFGQQTWKALRRHPRIVKMVNRTSGDVGMVTRQDFAEMFELDQVLVGAALVNTARPGQTAALANAWGKHAAFLRLDKTADTKRGLTFGMTVPYGTKVAGDWTDTKIGLRGGVRVRVGESVCELITAADAGYFFQNAVS